MFTSQQVTTIVGQGAVNNYLFAFLFFLFSFLLLIFLNKFGVLAKLIAGGKSSRSKFSDFLSRTFKTTFGWPFYFFISLYIGSFFIEFSSEWKTYFFVFILVLIAFYALKVLSAVAEYWIKSYGQGHEEEGDYVGVLRFFKKLVGFFLWMAVLLYALHSLGVNISGILTGFGIGSIVIAFAVQNILMDLFSYLLIYFDKPFVVGDFVETNDVSGTVKKIGIRSTRIDSVKGEELVISNRKIMDSVIHNYKKMVKKRKSLTLKVSGETDLKTMKKFLSEVQKVIYKQDNVDYDRVNFSDIGEKGYGFEIVYFVNVSNYNDYMDIQEKINFKMKEIIEKYDIKLA